MLVQHFMSEWYPTLHMYRILFIHSSVDRHLGFYFSATVNNAVLNKCVQVLCRHVFFSRGCTLRNRIAGLVCNSVFTLEELPDRLLE